IFRAGAAAGPPAASGLRLRPPSVDLLSGTTGEADALALVGAAHADARAFVAFRIEHHHVGHVDRPLLFDDSTRIRGGHVAGRAGFFVPFDDVQALDEHAALLRVGAEHFAG